MTTHNDVAATDVAALYNSGGFVDGDTIRITPGSGTVDFGGVFSLTKSVILEMNGTPALQPNPFGAPVDYVGTKTWPAFLDTSSLVPVRGLLVVAGANNVSTVLTAYGMRFYWDETPDWLGAGETWRTKYPGMMNALIGSNNLVGKEIHIDSCAFRGPYNMDESKPAAGDSPTNYFRSANPADASHKYFNTYARTARDMWQQPGQSTGHGDSVLRNAYMDPELGEVLYNWLYASPNGISGRLRHLSVARSLFEHLNGGVAIAGKNDGHYTVKGNAFLTMYGDSIQIGSSELSGAVDEVLFRDFRAQVENNFLGGMTPSDGLDLGNPHVDGAFQWYRYVDNAFAPLPGILSKNNFAMITPTARTQNQLTFGKPRDIGPKVINNHSFGWQKICDIQGGHSPFVFNTKGYTPGYAPWASVGVSVVAQNYSNKVDPSGPVYRGRGLIQDCAGESIIVANHEAKNNLSFGGANGLTIGAVLVDPATAPSSPFDAYERSKYKPGYARGKQYADLFAHLNDTGFTDVPVAARPLDTRESAIGAVATSEGTVIHCGRPGDTAAITNLPTGLEWRMEEYDGTPIGAWSASSGTVTDGKILRLRAPASTTATTAINYDYKVAGQDQRWTVTSGSAIYFPRSVNGSDHYWTMTPPGSGRPVDAPNGSVGLRGRIPASAKPGSGTITHNLILSASGSRLVRVVAVLGVSSYTIDFTFTNSAGGVAVRALGGATTFAYDKTYEFLFSVDMNKATGGEAVVAGRSFWRNVTDALPPTLITATTAYMTPVSGVPTAIVWSYSVGLLFCRNNSGSAPHAAFELDYLFLDPRLATDATVAAMNASEIGDNGEGLWDDGTLPWVFFPGRFDGSGNIPNLGAGPDLIKTGTGNPTLVNDQPWPAPRPVQATVISAAPYYPGDEVQVLFSLAGYSNGANLTLSSPGLTGTFEDLTISIPQGRRGAASVVGKFTPSAAGAGNIVTDAADPYTDPADLAVTVLEMPVDPVITPFTITLVDANGVEAAFSRQVTVVPG